MCVFQAKRLICDRLASMLLFTARTQPSNVSGQSTKTGSENYRIGDYDRDRTNQHTTENGVSDNQALTGILDLLETRISMDDKDRQRSDKDAKMRRDWMLAAAVIDRLCFIAFVVVFVGGTLVFVLLLALHKRRNLMGA